MSRTKRVPFRALGGALFKALVLRSGAPPRRERRRMRIRAETMLRELPGRRILVLPVGILNQGVVYSGEAGEMLAGLLRQVGFPLARADPRTFALPYPRQPNEAWIYWKRFRALGACVRASPETDTEYLLLMDVFGRTDGRRALRGVGAVHVLCTTHDGELAYGRLRNSHHDIFQRIKPTGMDHACQMAVEDLLASRKALGTCTSNGVWQGTGPRRGP